MSRRPCPDLPAAGELDSLKVRREQLLAETWRHRYRLHLLPELTRALRTTTTTLLERELQTRPGQTDKRGDVVSECQLKTVRLPYRDD